MSQSLAAAEAEDYRSLAQNSKGDRKGYYCFGSRRRSRFLASVADAGPEGEDKAYFAQRAAQETTAAVAASHCKARLAHLTMAQHYDALSHKTQHRADNACNKVCSISRQELVAVQRIGA